MTVALHHVDAFTDRPFAGNPAAVCLLDRPAPGSWMAAVAADLNLSETAFAWPLGPDGRYHLRWFTPTREVPLCGHATLATALVLQAEGRLPAGGGWTFVTASGELTVRPSGGALELDFPAYERRELTPPEREAVLGMLGTSTPAGGAGRTGEGGTGRTGEGGPGAVDMAAYGPKVLVALADRDAVESTVPDLVGLAAESARHGWEGLLTTATATTATATTATSAATDAVADDGDRGGYVLRYFCPAVGVDEDPVTGSAQCAAGPYWAGRTGNSRFDVVQVSRRRGELGVTVAGGGRVRITGRGVIVSSGRVLAEP